MPSLHAFEQLVTKTIFVMNCVPFVAGFFLCSPHLLFTSLKTSFQNSCSLTSITQDRYTLCERCVSGTCYPRMGSVTACTLYGPHDLFYAWLGCHGILLSI